MVLPLNDTYSSINVSGIKRVLTSTTSSISMFDIGDSIYCWTPG